MLPAPLALLVTLGVAYGWMKANEAAAQRGWLTPQVSRKIIHTGTGPLYVLTWLLYPDDRAVRLYAMLVPLALTVRVAAVGLGLWRDPATVQAMSRSGQRHELLRGPLLYGLVFVALTVAYGRTSPPAVAALMMLCGGDGLADLVGRRWGRAKLPWNRQKSWAGSAAFWLGGWALTALVAAVYTAAGVWPGPWSGYLAPAAAVALAAAAVESLPWREVDNLVVSLVALAVAHLVPWP